MDKRQAARTIALEHAFLVLAKLLVEGGKISKQELLEECEELSINKASKQDLQVAEYTDAVMALQKKLGEFL